MRVVVRTRDHLILLVNQTNANELEQVHGKEGISRQHHVHTNACMHPSPLTSLPPFPFLFSHLPKGKRKLTGHTKFDQTYLYLGIPHQPPPPHLHLILVLPIASYKWMFAPIGQAEKKALRGGRDAGDGEEFLF